MLNTMHLFAGAGGGLLCDLILGHNPIVAVEWDRYACQVLRERAAEGWFPNLSVWEGDVRLFDPSEYAGKVDCIHAGFPCQDISSAGKQAGVGPETRSGLYREVLRIAGVVRPKYLFLENVSAIVSNGLGTVLADLAYLGYVGQWTTLRASDCGAAHERDRWWGLFSDSNSKQYAVRRNSQDHAQTMAERRCIFGRGECNCWAGCEEVAGKSSGDVPNADDLWRLQPQRSLCDLGQWSKYSTWWEVIPELPRVVNGLAYQLDRTKGTGNGQVPLQAALAWKILGGP